MYEVNKNIGWCLKCKQKSEYASSTSVHVRHADIVTLHALYFIYYCIFICPFSIFICGEGGNMKIPPISAFFPQLLMSVSSFCQDSSLDFSFRSAFDNQISLGWRRASIFSVLVWIWQRMRSLDLSQTGQNQSA